MLTLFLALQGVVFWMFLRLLSSPDAPPGGVMEFFFGGTMMYWIALALLVTVRRCALWPRSCAAAPSSRC